MNIAFCYENVFPTRGGCATYIADLTRQLVADRHQVHVYARRWAPEALPPEVHLHPVSVLPCPRFIRHWLFGAACRRALRDRHHDVTVGLDKVWGLDVLYPQGGLHAASAEYNVRKHRGMLTRAFARVIKACDLAHRSYCLLERRQYMGQDRSMVVVNSQMVRHHFQHFYRLSADDLRVIPSAIDAGRFAEPDRPRRRMEYREEWGVRPEDTVGLFVGINYHLKGLESLLHAVARAKHLENFRLLVAGSGRTRWYERLARRLGVTDRVRFLGSRSDIQNCYFAADFLAHPTFYDPCSLVVLEALACGLPVITSRYNGAAELLGPAAVTSMEPAPGVEPRAEGFIVNDPHDPAALAWCLGQMLDRTQRRACAQAARRNAGEWTFAEHYRQLTDVFREAATRKKAA